MKVRHAAAALLAACSIGTEAFASNSQPGLISHVNILNNGVVMFNHSGTRSATPACHTQGGRWAFDGTTPAGQAKLSFLMTAYVTRKPVVVQGLASCAVWGDTETVDYIFTDD